MSGSPGRRTIRARFARCDQLHRELGFGWQELVALAAEGIRSSFASAEDRGQMLAELIASMKDADGNVVVDGFYDSVVPLGRGERGSAPGGAGGSLGRAGKDAPLAIPPNATAPSVARAVALSAIARSLLGMCADLTRAM